ncbi:MAG: 2Fe-2S iron-sulfur cluster-binding protein [Gammaproteobacteria bacterium]
MPTVIFVDHLGQEQTVAGAEGGSLLKLCEKADGPVPFHCRRGNCGTCRVELLEGGEALLPPAVHERRVLEIFGHAPHTHRLACQAQVGAGAGVVRVRPLGKRAPRPCSLWVPIGVDAGTRQMQARPPDAGAGEAPTEIRITGASELAVGAVIVATFQPASESRARSVVGKILRVDAEAGADGEARFMTAIHFLEHDATLKSLFPAAVLN